MNRARNQRKSRLITGLVVGLGLMGAAVFLDGTDDAALLDAEAAGVFPVAEEDAGVPPEMDGASAEDVVALEAPAAPAALPAPTAEPLAAPVAAAPRILVSLEKRRLWFVQGRDTLLNAPVAIGKGEDFEFEGKKYHFATPRGQRKVIAKSEKPVWTVPEWHYYEKAVRKKLEIVKLEKDSKIALRDGSFVVVVEDQVGRVNARGYFNPFTPGNEIIFDGKIFIPPMESAQRKVPDALGPYKLDMGDGFLIHGTHMYNEDSIGEAVSHGCIRMDNGDLTRLYELAPRGTAIVIF